MLADLYTASVSNPGFNVSFSVTPVDVQQLTP